MWVIAVIDFLMRKASYRLKHSHSYGERKAEIGLAEKRLTLKMYDFFGLIYLGLAEKLRSYMGELFFSES